MATLSDSIPSISVQPEEEPANGNLRVGVDVEEKPDGESGRGVLNRRSFATLGKRKTFSRKPSSWRHPGGTVSETEETDFSEYETDAESSGREGRRPEGRGTRHVHSFTFSSLSRFRNKCTDGKRDDNNASIFSRSDSQTDEETRSETMEVPKVTSPSRSPNRKLREATDRVGDKLRAYAQKFKENKEKDRVKQDGKRSASAGRSDTIQEESNEDIEAERVGISRTQSLVTRSARKAEPAHLNSPELFNLQIGKIKPPRKSGLRRSKSECDEPVRKEEEEEEDCKLVRAEREAEMGRMEGVNILQSLPEALKETSKELEILTKNWEDLVPDPEESSSYKTTGEIDHRSNSSEKDPKYPSEQVQVKEDPAKKMLCPETSSEIFVKQTSPGKPAKPGRRPGHGSRQGSKKRRKKDANFEVKAGLRKSDSLKTSTKTIPIRSASFSSLETKVEDSDARNQRSHLSLSPSTHPSDPETGNKLLGSSTLPRSTSKQRHTTEQGSHPSVLSLQLEGPYDKSMYSSSSREDTISPHNSTSAGLVGESTETLTNVEDSILEGGRNKTADISKPRSELLFPELMKTGHERLMLAATRSATVEEETEIPVQEETVQVFETPYGSVFEGGILHEIKIAEVVEIQGEQTEESTGFQVEESPSRADLVDVGCDAEVAQLTCRHSQFQAYIPSIYTDWRNKGAVGRNIKLVVQDCDSDLPDLEWEGPVSPWSGGNQTSARDTSDSASPWMQNPQDPSCSWVGSSQESTSSWTTTWPSSKFLIQRVPSKDTDSTSSLTTSHGDQTEVLHTSHTDNVEDGRNADVWREIVRSSPVNSSEVWQKMAVQTVANKLSSEIWQELAVQSPENTIYSASMQKNKERKNILEMDWMPGTSQAKKDRDPNNLTKAATFPRLSQKSEDSRSKYFYRDQPSQIGDFDSDYEAYRISGAEDTDQDEEETIEEAIKHQAVDAKPRKEEIYCIGGQDLILQKKTDPTFQIQQTNKGFKLPEGFVTPVRITPNRNVHSTDAQRNPRLPRGRHLLRGPFGEMLMEEMAKSSTLKSKSSCGLSKSSPVSTSQPLIFSSPSVITPPFKPLQTQSNIGVPATEQGESPLVFSPTVDSQTSRINQMMPDAGGPPTSHLLPVTVVQTMGVVPVTASFLSTTATPSTIQPKHQRTRSSPSRIEYDKLDTSILQTNLGKPFLQGSAPVPPDQGQPLLQGDEVLLARVEKGKSAFRIIKDTRALIAREVLQVEKSYVDSLQFLIIKYMHPLKNHTNAFSIDSNLVDDIFYQIPAILLLHQTFLEELKRRLDHWEPKQTIGDWFIQSFSKKSVLEAYTGFIRNVKRADDAIRVARSIKPAFDRFLQEMRRERKGERLSLTDLLAKPHQRIPRYRLLIQRLLEHTDPDHEDYNLLQRAEREIHDLALKISTVEKEATEQEIRQGVLRQLELLVHGLGPGDLASPSRTLIRHDLVTSSTTTWIRKERCVFLFTDLVVITTVSRRGTRRDKEGKKSVAGASTLNQILETCRHKLWMYLSLTDVEIGKDEVQRRSLKEFGDIDEDIKLLQCISEQVSRLNCPHREIDETIKNTLTNLNKQVSDRHSLDPASGHVTSLQLSIHTADGPEAINLVFDTPEAKSEWENQLTKCKENLENSIDPPPNLINLIPIRKTRAGLQFTCAAPTLGFNSHGLKDVWVCNSDGYVGQVCVLSLRPDPTVICCNGVCNARILSIASVPSSQQPDQLDWSRHSSGRKDWPSWSAPSTPATLGWVTPPTSTEWTSKSWTVNSDGGTAESSPQSVGVSHILDLSSEDEDDINMRNSQLIDRPTQVGATMWLGTEDGTIHVYNCTDNIRLKKNKEKFTHPSPVLHILHFNSRVYVSVGSGDVYIYSRDNNGVWDKSGCITKTIGSSAHPVSRMCVVMENVWCATHNKIRSLDTVSHAVNDETVLQADHSRSIVCMEVSGIGLWLVQQGSAVVHLYNIQSRTFLLEVNVVSTVSKLLSNCDEIIRQHKTACLRVTSILPVKDSLWIGTSAGVIVTAVLPTLTETTTKLPSNLQLSGVSHGHTGHVRFLTSVQLGSERSGVVVRGDSIVDGSFKEALRRPSVVGRKDSKKDGVAGVPGQILVISGGDGYEDFSNNSNNDLAGREDSTNHLLLWSV